MNTKILVADDEPDVLEYLASYIPLLGYTLETARDGAETLAKVNFFKPGLLLLDLLMPKTDGLTVLKEVKKHHPEMKVLVVTGTRASHHELIELGADGVIYKPIDLTNLSEEIKSLLPPLDETQSKKAEFARLEIVEDEAEIRDYLKKDLFERLGFEVDTAKDVDEGWEIYRTKLPHIVIVDLACPTKQNGYDFIQKLTQTTNPPPPKSIIIETAYLGDGSEELKSLERQGYPIIGKPLDSQKLERLKERVLEACQKHGLRLKRGSGGSQGAS